MIQPARPVSRVLAAYPLDYAENPLTLFARLRHLHGAILLDSGAPSPAAGTFDIMSALPLATLSVDANGHAICEGLPEALRHDPIAAQRHLLQSLNIDTSAVPAHLPFKSGLLGAWSYEFGRLLEGLPAHSKHSEPLAQVGLYDWALVLDHHNRQTWLLATEERQRELMPLLESACALGNAPAPGAKADFCLASSFKNHWSRTRYEEAFARVQAYIRAGDCYQINLTQAFSAAYEGDEWNAYLHLRSATPSPFSAFMQVGDSWLLSVSPERFIRVSQRQVIAQPIKGTRPRGTTPQQDAQFAQQLEQSLKDRAENVMIVDLLRNDLGRVCRPGSIKVPDLVKRIAYANVHHLVSTVSGELRAECDALDVLAASLPGGSITGAPKHRAMQIIDEIEAASRRYYCGSIGYIDVDGNMDTSITIRTAVAHDRQLTLWGGGGVVADSSAADEYAESLAKIARLMEALPRAPSSSE